MIQNRYLIVQLIGKGGMGEVYLAVDQRLGSAIALKRTFFADDEMLGNAFEREARTLARLRHPVLPKVSDHFSENGEQYLVMEHIAGDDLSKRLEAAQKPFPTSWVLFWADQLLDALSYLHSHEPPIIHRDIKPQNLKLTDENHIVLLDFGLSKNSTGQTITSGTGSSGSVVGYTPHYAPMEQIRGTGTNQKSDLYSLSATLYQLMTNSVPADALSRADSLLNAMPDPIRPLSEINPEISPDVSAVILKGMEVSQEKRWPNAREMQRALRKAYSSMQEAMTAHTVAFTADTELGSVPSDSFGKTAPPAQPLDHAASPSSEGPTRISTGNTGRSGGFVDQGTSQPSGNSGVRQADVKTEVFRAGDSPLNGSEFNIPQEKPAPFTEDFSTSEPSEPNFSADATIPNIAYEQASLGNTGAVDAASVPEFFTTPNIDANSNPFATVTAPPSGTESQPERAAVISAPVNEPRPSATVSAKKKSSSKTVILLGVLAVLFVVGIGAVGAGWFVYSNYYAGATVEPSPSPQPTPEISPSPEPTMESVSVSNSDVTNVNTNQNSNVSVEPTPAPTPEITTVPVTPRANPTPQTTVRTTPVRPERTPVVKATPKPRTNNRTDIIQ